MERAVGFEILIQSGDQVAHQGPISAKWPYGTSPGLFFGTSHSAPASRTCVGSPYRSSPHGPLKPEPSQFYLPAPIEIQASESGSFDMRASVGQLWARAIKQNNELKAAYSKIGKNWTLQREFRASWAKSQFEALTSQRMEIENSTQADRSTGSYMSLSKLIWAEKNRQAALKYMNWAVRQWQAGQSAGDKPYVNYNEKTEQFEFWYTEERQETGAEKIWQMQRKGGEIQTGTKRALADGKAHTVEDEGKPLKKNRGKTEATPQKDDEKDKSHKIRREIDALMNKAKVLKTRADGAVSSYHYYASKIELDEEWEFARAKLPKLLKAKAELDASKGLNAFWQEWALSKNFVQTAKKAFTTEELLKYFQPIGKVEASVAELEDLLEKVKNMYKAQ